MITRDARSVAGARDCQADHVPPLSSTSLYGRKGHHQCLRWPPRRRGRAVLWPWRDDHRPALRRTGPGLSWIEGHGRSPAKVVKLAASGRCVGGVRGRHGRGVGEQPWLVGQPECRPGRLGAGVAQTGDQPGGGRVREELLCHVNGGGVTIRPGQCRTGISHGRGLEGCGSPMQTPAPVGWVGSSGDDGHLHLGRAPQLGSHQSCIGRVGNREPGEGRLGFGLAPGNPLAWARRSPRASPPPTSTG